MPKDKNSYMEMCRIIGMVETSHDFGEVRHIINPFFGDKNNLNEYAEDITFYNNLDSVFIPVLRGPRMSGPDISKGV